jgi:hypothetical protein
MPRQIENSSCDFGSAYTPALRERTSNGSGSSNAPLMAALVIETALLEQTVKEIRARRGQYAFLADRFDHHQGRIDVLLSQVER